MTVWRRRKDKKPPEPYDGPVWTLADLVAIARAAQADEPDADPHTWWFDDGVHDPTPRKTWEA